MARGDSQTTPVRTQPGQNMGTDSSGLLIFQDRRHAIVGRFDNPPAVITPGATERTKQPTQTTREITFAPAAATIPLLYGRTKMGGGIIYGAVIGSVEYLAIAVCEGEIDAVEAIYFDDQPVARFGGVTYNVYRGTLDQGVDPIISGIDSTWIQSFPGLAYVVFRIVRSEEIDSTPNITFVVRGRKVVDPRAVHAAAAYDTWPTTYSESPPLHLADLLTNQEFGGKFPMSLMNWAGTITRSADFCDENIGPNSPVGAPTITSHFGGNIVNGNYKWAYTVIDGVGNETAGSLASSVFNVTAGGANVTLGTMPAGGAQRRVYRTKSGASGGALYYVGTLTGTASDVFVDTFSDAHLGAQVPNSVIPTPRFRYCGILETTTRLQDWIDTLRAHCQAWFYSNGTTYDIQCDEPWTGPPVAYFTDSNIIDIRVDVAGIKDTPTRVETDYTDSLNDWKDATVARELAAVTTGTQPLIVATMQLKGCPTGDQGARHSTYQLNSRLADDMLTLKVLQPGLLVVPGDVVSVTHAIGFSNALFRVIQAVESSDGGEWDLLVREYTADAYSNTVVQVDANPGTSLPDPYAPPPAPTGCDAREQIKVGGDGSLTSEILVTWTNGDTPLYAGTQIVVNDGRNNITLPLAPSGPQEILSPTIGQTYTITLRTINVVGVPSEPVQVQCTPVFSGDFVPDVTNLTTPINVNASLGQVWWDQPNYPYMDHYVIYDTYGSPDSPPIIATVPAASAPSSTEPLYLPQAVHGDGYSTPQTLSIEVVGFNSVGNWSAGVSGGWTLPASGTGSYAVDFDPRDVNLGGDYIWVCNFGSDTVQRIDRATGAVVSTIAIPHTTGSVSQPFQSAYDGANVWVSAYSQNHLVKIDGAALTTSNILDPTIVNPVGITFDGTSIWVVGNGTSGKAWKINPTANTLTATVSVGNQPAFVSALDGYIYVSNFNDNTVSVIDAASATVQATIQVGAGPVGICNDGASIWVANYRDGTISKIDPASRAVTATVDLGRGSGPVDLAFDGSYIWVTEGAHAELARVNPSTGTITARAALPSFPRTIVWDGSDLWIANNTNGTTGYQDVTVVSPAPGGGTSNVVALEIAGSDFNPLPFVV